MIRRLKTKEAAAELRMHPVTVLRLLESGELHGTQRAAGCQWLIREDCLEAFADGVKCAHQSGSVVSIDAARSQRSKRA